MHCCLCHGMNHTVKFRKRTVDVCGKLSKDKHDDPYECIKCCNWPGTFCLEQKCEVCLKEACIVRKRAEDKSEATRIVNKKAAMLKKS